MASYKIFGQYNYEGVIEAESEDEAFKIFYKNLHMYYESPEDEVIVEICTECDYDIEDCECDVEEEVA